MKPFSQVKFLLFLCLSASVPALPQSPSQRGVGVASPAPVGEKRVALVIGNAKYAHISVLANPVNDARDMAVALRQVGFEVISGEDLSYQAMEEKVASFGTRLTEGSVGLFFYAGHGVQADGKNYLIPVDADLQNKVQLKTKTLLVDEVLGYMEESKTRLNILILDACRNNPFRSFARTTQGGLAGMTGFPGQIYISYATAADRVASDGAGRNGLFTGELLQHLRQPGVELQKVFKNVRAAVHQKSNGAQVPFEYNSIVDDFYFIAPTGQSAPARPADEKVWGFVKTTRNPAVVRQFLTEFPTSQYARAARLLLTELENQAAQPEAQNNVMESAARSGSWVLLTDKPISLPAHLAWTETFITVQAGQQVDITATGQVNLGTLGYSRADGIALPDTTRPAQDCPTGSLIARIGERAEYTCIGTRKTFVAAQGGRLWLGLNDSRPADNRDALAVKVRIHEFRR